jgi:hypothetical protein
LAASESIWRYVSLFPSLFLLLPRFLSLYLDVLLSSSPSLPRHLRTSHSPRRYLCPQSTRACRTHNRLAPHPPSHVISSPHAVDSVRPPSRPIFVRRAVRQVAAAVYDIALNATLSAGYMGTEENIFSLVYYRFPELVHLYNNGENGNCAIFSEVASG